MTVLLRDDAGVLQPVLINVSADQIREIIEKAEECGRQLGSALSRCRLCGCHEGFGPKGQASASRISVEGWRGCVMRWAAVLFLILVVGVLYAEKPALGSIVPTAKIHPALEIQIIGVPDPPQDIKAPYPSFPIAMALSLRQKSLCLEGDRAGFACLQRRQHVLIAGLPRVGGLHEQREIRPVHLAMGFTNMSPRSADVHYLDVAADECSGMKEFGEISRHPSRRDNDISDAEPRSVGLGEALPRQTISLLCGFNAFLDGGESFPHDFRLLPHSARLSFHGNPLVIHGLSLSAHLVPLLSHDVSLLPVNLNQPSHQESLNDSSDAEHPIHGDAQFVLAGIAACTGLWLQVRGHEAIGRRSRIKAQL